MLSIQTHFSADGHPSERDDAREFDAFVSLGDVTDVLVGEGGALVWRTMVFGFIKPSEDGLLAHARFDQLELKERWATAINRRVAVPICGYRWLAPRGDWMKVAAGWAPGFHENGRFVLVSRPGLEPRPVIGSRRDAETWLTAKQWDARGVLRDMAARIAA